MNTTNTKSTTQHSEFIALADCTPTNYQCTTKDAHVTDISNNFDEAKLGTLTVSLRDGKYHIIDGLHRSKALKTLGYTHALAIVLTGLTYEQEAELFRRLNKDKREVSTFDDFHAGLEAKDEMCVKINDIIKANGFQISKGSGFSNIQSIKALCGIVEYYGYKVLDDTLCLLANTWSGIPKASDYEFLIGTAEFVSRYGMREFAERMKDKYAVICFEYSEAMRFRGSVGSATSRHKFCRILVEQYNKGYAHNNKKRLVWEESK
ncbi:hypothetical protein FACS189425_03470 [Clostridia bacterium]|nr:hypothetical protein FACS189425_03470 [Clostridia bacterium]